MKTFLKLSYLLLIPFLFVKCECTKEPGEDCLELVGTYKGTFTGSFSGELTLVVTHPDAISDGVIKGTWSGVDPNTGMTFSGKIYSSYFDCSSGKLEDAGGLGLTSPSAILCPPGADYCYSTGASLGKFEGEIDSRGGTGTWSANSDSAETIGVTGNGTWSVTKL